MKESSKSTIPLKNLLPEKGPKHFFFFWKVQVSLLLLERIFIGKESTGESLAVHLWVNLSTRFVLSLLDVTHLKLGI